MNKILPVTLRLIAIITTTVFDQQGGLCAHKALGNEPFCELWLERLQQCFEAPRSFIRPSVEQIKLIARLLPKWTSSIKSCVKVCWWHCIRSGQEEEYRTLIKDFIKPPAPEHQQNQRAVGRLQEAHASLGACDDQRWLCADGKDLQIWECSWKTNWTGLLIWTLCVKEERADYTSLEGWHPSVSEKSCCKCSIRWLWRAPSSRQWCTGEAA